MRDQSEFIVSGTVSAIAEILFFNKVTNSFVFIGLHATKRPSGLIKYEFEFHKPMGIVIDDSKHFFLVIFELIEIGLMGLYVFKEVYTYLRVLYLYIK